MNTLAVLLSSRVKAELLRLLFGSEPHELHVRELERRAKLSVSTVRQELKRLTGVGVIVARKDGNRTYYRADPRHPIYPDLRNLVLKTSGLADVLRTPLQHPAIRLAFVFGSMADGSAKAHSDVDLMVIGDIGLRQLSRLLSKPTEELGREINPHILTVDEFVRRKRMKDHFVSTVLGKPKLFIIGDEYELEGLGG